MWTVLIIMGTGMIAGYFLRSKKKIAKINDKLTMAAVFALLFFMGVAIGSDKEMISNLYFLGINALVISIAGIVFSVLVAIFVYRLFFKKNV